MDFLLVDRKAMICGGGHGACGRSSERYGVGGAVRGCEDVRSSRHFQTIWLLAKGHSTGEVAAMTSFGQRWIEQLLERYNALGPSAMGDLRRGNGAPARVLRPNCCDVCASFGRSSARRRGLDERQGCALDGGRVGPGLACAAARLGGVAGDRLVDPEAAAAQPEGGDA